MSPNPVLPGAVEPVEPPPQRPLPFCGCPCPHGLADSIAAPPLLRWPMQHLRWCVLGALPGLTAEQTLTAYNAAWDAWAAVCAITHEQTDQLAEAQVIITHGPVDGPRGVLAWSELPDGTASDQITQRYDSAEDWVHAIDPAIVAAHEIGHALGLGHLATGCLMAPVYNPAIKTPQPADVGEAIRRYGVRVPVHSHPP